MRGDSRLDLYAKSLALGGLGLVGMVGALIDYLPGPVRLPHVGAAQVRRAAPVVQTLVDMRGLDDSESVPGDLPVARAGARVEYAALGDTAPLSHVLPDELPEGSAVAVGSDAGPSHVVAGLHLQSISFGSTLPLVNLAADVDIEAQPSPLNDDRTRPPWQPMSAPLAAVDRSEDGFFAGMLKKTSSSVTSSLGKASNSVVGAVRAVGGAVKKAF